MITEYQTQNELNPKLWDGDVLRPGLRAKLLKIAQYFFEHLGVDVDIKDIILTGSNVNYNWTSQSDIDLHVVINYKDVDPNISLVRDFMLAKKSIWNNSYPLTYKELPIELYAQDENEPHAATGIYSLLKDKWIKRPNQEQISIDDELIDAKAMPYRYEIDSLQQNDPQFIFKVKSLKRRLKHLRQTGLEKSGEYSIENLAFKSLRNSGYLAKLADMLKSYTYNKLSME